MAPSSLNGRQLKWIAVFAFASFLWKSFTQRSPFFLLPTIPALPTPHGCAVHHPDIASNCEDFTTIPNSPLVILSCDTSRRLYNHIIPIYPPPSEPLPAGELYLFNPTVPSALPQLLTPPARDFRPVGISALLLSPSTARLFVANQAVAGPRVEIIDVDLESASATPVATIVHPLLTSPNGIAATNATGFYVTNDMWSARRSLVFGALEILSGLPGGSLLWISFVPSTPSATTAKKLARLPFANGIAVDPATSRLWVASSLKGVYAYTFDPVNPAVLVNNKRGEASFHRTSFLPDNLAFAAGELYVSGPPSPMLLAAYVGSADAAPPPSIAAKLVASLEKGEGPEFKLKVAERGHDVSNTGLRKEEWRWKTVFYDDGGLYGGMSGVSVGEGGVLVGTGLMMGGVLVCAEVPVKGPLKEVVREVKDEL